jgi:TatD DNase family protein
MLFDSHIHLDQYPAAELDRMITDWRAAGIMGVVAVSTNLASAHRTLELKSRHPNFVYAALGYHPEQALPHPLEREELFSLLKQERIHIHAVGEVGLPYYSSYAEENIDEYGELLGRFAELAVDLDLPIVLHAVHEKAAPALEIIQAQQVRRAHFHWLKAPPDVVERIIACGYCISVTPEVCYRERDQKLALQVPLSQLLFETDGPWPYNGTFAGKPTTPLLLHAVAEKVAELHDISVVEAAAHSTEAARNLYGI